MLNVFLILESVVIAMILIAMLLLLNGEGSREQKLMVYFLSGCMLSNVAYVLELTADTLEAALVAIKMEYLGQIYVPLMYCLFLYSYCYRKLPAWIERLLFVIDTIVLALNLTSGLHTFYYRKVEWLQDASGHYAVSLTYGPGYYVFLIFCCAVPYLLCFGVLMQALVTSPDHAESGQYKIFLVLSTAPLLAIILYAGKLTAGYDTTPLLIGFMLSFVEISVWSRRDYDLRHTALDVVLQNMAGGVLALDKQKHVMFYNNAAEKIFPELAPRLLGDSVEKLENFQVKLLDVNGKGSFSIGRNHYESQTEKIFNRNARLRGYVVLILDVTETKNYIEEIKQVREQAVQANMAKSEFLANMSHEIRTPMNAITGLSDIIIEESRGRRLYPYARDIKSAAQNLLSIINDILDLSKVEAGKMELVCEDYYVKSAVSEVIGMMDIAASQRGLLMKYEYDLKIPCRYHGDVGRIKQILINLLNNAVKFTQHGYVKISVSGQPLALGEELLIFQVKDTGSGIRKEDQKKIFENFKQLDSRRNRSVEGTGLGLSITKRLVELMGGSVGLESVYGKGSTFTVKIPQKVVDARTLEEAPDIPVSEEEHAQMFTAEGYRVLLVDDNLINRKVAKRLLESYRFELMEAASGPEAIELVRKNRYDIIFMDHMMPEMDGIEAVQIIRSRCGENGTAPVIIALTANAMAGVREKFLESGFQDFLPKPLERKDLSKMLAKWIPEERKKYFDDEEPGEDEEPELDEIQIRGIDTNAILEQYPQPEDYREILELYCMDSRRKLPLIRELAEKHDFKNYEIEVHALKSASANIGAMELSDLAKEHELAAARGNEAYVLRNFEELLRLYGKQVEYIRRFLNEEKEEEDAGNDREALMPEVLAQKIREALSYLENFQSKECAGVVEELLKGGLDAETEESLKEIQEQLRLYEDDHAEELLGSLLERLGKEA